MGILVATKFNKVGSRSHYSNEFPEMEVQGAKELELLCPVSKLTGFPMSMQQAIFMISDKNSRLADVLFEEIPALKSDDSISDDDKLKLLVSRLESGSFFENDKVAEQLGLVAKEFFPNADVDKVVDDAKITFAQVDSTVADGQ